MNCVWSRGRATNVHVFFHRWEGQGIIIINKNFHHVICCDMIFMMSFLWYLLRTTKTFQAKHFIRREGLRTHNEDDMGLRTLRIYLYLYLFLLDSFTYLPFIDVSYNLWLVLTPPCQPSTYIDINRCGKFRVDRNNNNKNKWKIFLVYTFTFFMIMGSYQ